jgi:hypothetical protein
MLNINANKQSYLSEFIQARLNALVVFGFTRCEICLDNVSVKFLEFEHFYTSEQNAIAVYPACSSCNKEKGKANVNDWFNKKSLSIRFCDISEKLNQFSSIQQFERDNAFIAYITHLTNVCRDGINALPDGIIRLMVQPIPRNLLVGLDLTNVRINKNQAIANKLDKYFDLSNANLE